MEKKSIVFTALGLAIAIIVIASVLIPVLNDAERGYKTEKFDNPAGNYAEKITAGSIEFSIADSTLKLNGNDWTSTGKIPMFVADNFLIQMNGSNNQSNITYYAGSAVRVDNAKSINMTYANKTINLTYVDSSDNEVSVNIDSKWAYAVTNGESGSYIAYNLYATSKTVYYSSVGDFAASGYAMNGDVAQSIYSIGNGVATINGVAADLNINGFTEVDGYNQLYTGAISYNKGLGIVDGDNTVYPWFVVMPAQVDGYVEPSQGYTALLAAIPVMVIVALLVAAVSIIAKRE